MTAHPNLRLTRCTITLVLSGALVLGGAIVGTAMWPNQHAAAAPANSSMQITALMSTVDVASLPMTEIADLF
jgi:hypothetical protein